MIRFRSKILSNTLVKIEKDNEIFYLPANKLNIDFIISLSISKNYKDDKLFKCPKCGLNNKNEGICWDCKCKDLYLIEEEEIEKLKFESKKQKFIDEINSKIYNFKSAELILPIIHKI